ncbi:hypothetical protein A9K55_007035 [Cordyceps militaris]|uniref:Uncharacterized protein n=1 Tax=Cordyceps militaris TaxID=73501 RepID=A0A2H4SF41_CORMI|nr:hypothetical protein A9K55_007035 [Cordyceps militaris]
MISTLKATVLLLLSAVTSAAALPSMGDNCVPGEFSCAFDTILWTCNSQREFVVSADCGLRCCREDRERHTAYCSRANK